MTDKYQTVSDWQRSDYGQDNNKPSQVVMFSYGEKESVLNNAQDTFVSLTDGMKGGDVFWSYLPTYIFLVSILVVFVFKKYGLLTNGISYPNFSIYEVW